MTPIIIASIFLILGIILVYLAIKKEKKRKEIIITEKDPLNIEGKNAGELLKNLTNSLKFHIKKYYKISDKLSLREAIKELEKKEKPFFLDIAKSLEEYFYTEKKPQKNDLIKLKNKFIKKVKEKEDLEKKILQQKKKNMSLLEKIHEKEKEIREKTRIEKIRLKKLKRNTKVSKNP